MVAQAKNRFLFLLKSKAKVCLGLVKKLSKITSRSIIMRGFKINAILWSKLLFYAERKLPLLDVVIVTLTTIRMVKSVKRISKIPKGAVLGPTFGPGTSAQVFCV